MLIFLIVQLVWLALLGGYVLLSRRWGARSAGPS